MRGADAWSEVVLVHLGSEDDDNVAPAPDYSFALMLDRAIERDGGAPVRPHDKGRGGGLLRVEAGAAARIVAGRVERDEECSFPVAVRVASEAAAASLDPFAAALRWGFEVIVTDTDALVLRDPWPFMAQWPDAGFLTTSDHLGNTTKGQGLENHGGIHTAFNIGYMFFRKGALPLVEEWRRVIREQPTQRWDQGE